MQFMRGYWSQLQNSKRSSMNSFLIESQKTVIVFHSVVSLHSMWLQSVVGNQITHGLLPAACRRDPSVGGKLERRAHLGYPGGDLGVSQSRSLGQESLFRRASL